VRIAVGPDPVSGHSRYRSLTVHGDRETAQAARERWAAQAELVRSSGRTRPGITLAALLREWLCADHGWRPSTVAGYRSVARFLTQDPVGKRRAVDLTPKVLAAACADWRWQGWPDPTVWARMRVLRSALGWAYAERIVDLHPLDGMRSPPHAAVRMHAPVDQVRAILACARQQAIDAAIREGRSPSDNAARHRAEQTLLLTRLAADSGARRGELAALQLGDLDGDIRTIARATSNEVVGPTKSGRIRRLTLGPTTAALWRHTVTQWRQRAGEGQRFGPWLFSRRADHTTPCPHPASRTGSPNSAPTPATRTSPSTASGTQWPPPWYPKETSCKPNTGSGTATPPPPCGSTATSCHSQTTTSRRPSMRYTGRETGW